MPSPARTPPGYSAPSASFVSPAVGDKLCVSLMATIFIKAPGVVKLLWRLFAR